MYELIVFDLDNTLARSKTIIDDEMSEIFSKLLSLKKVAIISGGGFKQFEKEILYSLSIDTNFNNLHLFPTEGTTYYNWDNENGKWQIIYQEKLSERNKIKIKNAFSEVLNKIKLDIDNIYGEQVEDRDSALTFSALGQDAPLELKEKWDPDNKKRTEIRNMLLKRIPEFEIGIAGTTSIDITMKNHDKAYGIGKMIEYIKIPKEKIIFIGDSVFDGGNDSPVLSTGVKVIAVKNPEETKTVIRDIINNKI